MQVADWMDMSATTIPAMKTTNKNILESGSSCALPNLFPADIALKWIGGSYPFWKLSFSALGAMPITAVFFA